MSIVILTITLLALILAITKFHVHPFLALLCSGIFLGLATGMPMDKTLDSLLDGFAHEQHRIHIDSCPGGSHID